MSKEMTSRVLRGVLLAGWLLCQPGCKRTAEQSAARLDAEARVGGSSALASPAGPPSAEPPQSPPTERTRAAPAPEANGSSNADSGELSVVQAPSVAPDLSAGEVFDVGPAGPATATPQGVVMLSRSADLFLARWPGKKLEPVAVPEGGFAPSGPGPSVLGEHAYFVLGGKLLRKKLGSSEPPERLADEAHDGARVSAELHEGKPIVAYLAREPERLVARLWRERHEPITLSPPATQANSVRLALLGPELWAVYLEARTGMSQLHARRWRRGRAEPEADLVVWVGGGSSPFTEVTLVQRQDELFALLALELDISRFGLAILPLGSAPYMGVEASWYLYENGLSRAPVSATVACGGPLVLYVVPASADPSSTQELRLASLAKASLERPRTVARGRSISQVSLAAQREQLLIAYVADGRTWARVVHCKHLY